MLFGSPEVGDVVVLMPADAAVGAVNDLETDKLGHVFGIKSDVGEKGVVGPFGFGDEGFAGVVTGDLVFWAGGFSSLA